MSLTLTFRPEAIHDINALFDYIAQTNRTLAQEFVGQVFASCYHLERFPHLGKARPDLQPGLRTLVVRRRVIIAYVLTEETVDVIRALGAGQDYEAILGETQTPPG